MAKELEFKEYKGTHEDADGDEHTSTVRACLVTEDTARRVQTRVGGHDAVKGEYLVETDAPGVYDVLSEEAWKSTGYSKRATPTGK